MRTILGIIGLLTISCGGDVPPKPNQQLDTEILKDKFSLYTDLSLQHPERDGYGMFGSDGSIGDSALFSCLHQFATGVQVDILASFSEEGLPLRHPEISPEYSATPISRDMLIGFMLCAISSPDGAEIMKKVVDAGRTNNWDMCGSAPEYEIDISTRIGRCIVSPGLISTLYRVRTYLGVDCNTACRAAQYVPTGLSTHVEGFRRHLTMLHILIRGYTGGISKGELDLLQFHAEREPNNALYTAIYHKFLDGNQSRAQQLLLDNNRFPRYSLPTNENYCTHYLYQRDESSIHDWQPCDRVRNHIGIDFLFATRLTL